MLTAEGIFRVLIAAKQVITERGWCQAAMAMDTWGKIVSPISADAEKLCIEGALNRGLWLYREENISDIKEFGEDLEAVKRIVREATGIEKLNRWNDAPTTKKEAVLDALDKSILYMKPIAEMEEKRGKQEQTAFPMPATETIEQQITKEITTMDKPKTVSELLKDIGYSAQNVTEYALNFSKSSEIDYWDVQQITAQMRHLNSVHRKLKAKMEAKIKDVRLMHNE